MNKDTGAKVTVRTMSLFTILQAAFIIMKVAKVIDWSWWLVLIPLWTYLGLLVILFVVIFILISVNEKKQQKKWLNK